MTIESDEFSLSELDWSPDGTQLITRGSDAKVWNIATGQNIFTFEYETSLHGDIVWSPNGDRIAIVDAGRINILDALTFEILETIPGASHIAWSPDGSKIAYGGSNGVVGIVNAPPLVPCDTTTVTDNSVEITGTACR